MQKTLDSAVDAIGRTPLVRLSRITSSLGLDGDIVAKLDYLNPGGSKKDRVALGIIEEAERLGTLKPGQTVVELTSGNTGTGLAIVCSVKGYPFVAVMSRGNSIERARMMAALGAEVVLVNQAPGSMPGQVSGSDLELVERRAKEIEAERGAFRADQFTRDGNWVAHHDGTGVELWEQTDGAIDGFVDFVGSGGTYAGVSRKLKSLNDAIRCFIVEPEGAAVLARREVTNPGHPIQGGGYMMSELAFLEDLAVDGLVQVTGDEAKEGARVLAMKEGIFGGFSSGANLMAAIRLLRGEMRGKTVAIVICDSGLKYMSTDLWTDQQIK
ncbi:tryptophan synthase beta subunit-like PLP-dependent enzyme [Emericellopsis cladophorae]|uniref:Tryptophan synthase beta subunit-like PLP-dependent enzyme n=1 Tax=Emericellopsis cladophorae TaxID=2686198 RepID=A0A9Q0BBR1_9HYPO|nr:tryptophan synthase beta subunit-like PLP-dependent enzyme [Emericellopsis cladophorae]KAI6778324.1 tryptophan synthase beta subunit-like PLP-dependent enzyme [Emericellopsis cladophorae]